ncbi:MAG: hypothetical protein ACREBU_16235 [Nitrososphaera sp.]
MTNISASTSLALAYWLSRPRGERTRIRKEVNISLVHIWGIFNHRWGVSPETANRISLATGGELMPETIVNKEQVYRLGIDPGISTGYAIIDRERQRCIDTEVIHCMERPVRGKGKWFNIEQLEGALDIHKKLFLIAYVELPVLLPFKGTQTIATQFETLGVIRAILHSHKIPVNWIAAKEWKRRAGLIKKGKEASVELARSLYAIERTLNHDCAEAILIAHFG